MHVFSRFILSSREKVMLSKTIYIYILFFFSARNTPSHFLIDNFKNPKEFQNCNKITGFYEIEILNEILWMGLSILMASCLNRLIWLFRLRPEALQWCVGWIQYQYIASHCSPASKKREVCCFTLVCLPSVCP